MKHPHWHDYGTQLLKKSIYNSKKVPCISNKAGIYTQTYKECVQAFVQHEVTMYKNNIMIARLVGMVLSFWSFAIFQAYVLIMTTIKFSIQCGCSRQL